MGWKDELERLINENPSSDVKVEVAHLLEQKTEKCEHPNMRIESGFFCNTWKCPDCGHFDHDMGL